MTASGRSFLAYCRPGFEGECAQELAAADAELASGGFARSQRNSGHVEFVLPDAQAATRFARSVSWRDLVFARQLLRVIAKVEGLPREDRLASLLPPIQSSARRYKDAWIESPDSDAARELAGLCRSLNNALIARMKREQMIDPTSAFRLHICLTDAQTAFVAEAEIAESSPWPGGIPRLRFPSAAPSRSTLKLEEALLTLLDADERERWLKPGMTGVDLGAAPGGWTWQLARRSISVTAVDNGPMDQGLLDSGLVTHLRADGFRYQPQNPVDWMVCDMVEQPIKVAARMAEWLANGWCRHTIFNLKLPMKKRFDEVVLCRRLVEERVDAVGKRMQWRARQLYHDREEITVFARIR
ncbi:MAG TPA: 23S rRNA (cytidine(2498)-2'-O)-methyltransferase RlmM [Dokdonella sp.]|uniref:23S rRNA (cytidine(2498)-2'-O)-methyltransferase RlmM n=1 Tax=Dokdonella sp. TaxID=2291710 RepID=UPI002D7E49E9|nr:23S rRNA (cytidine(2498)-2'-O)-methyltransferase RlmM [Dokdonella sp.]HET9031816.1 23S rRNA (cytidine(2498)-2'-O)-methyltransferase RlmM [Dokdonella sp.]